MVIWNIDGPQGPLSWRPCGDFRGIYNPGIDDPLLLAVQPFKDLERGTEGRRTRGKQTEKVVELKITCRHAANSCDGSD